MHEKNIAGTGAHPIQSFLHSKKTLFGRENLIRHRTRVDQIEFLDGVPFVPVAMRTPMSIDRQIQDRARQKSFLVPNLRTRPLVYVQAQDCLLDEILGILLRRTATTKQLVEIAELVYQRTHVHNVALNPRRFQYTGPREKEI